MDILQIFSSDAENTADNTAVGADIKASAQEITSDEKAPGGLSSEEEFEELIKGKYADAFSKRTKGIIDKRFAKYKGYEKTALACTPLLEKMRGSFPDIDENDTEGLVNAFLMSLENENKQASSDEESSELYKKAHSLARERAAEKAAAYLIEESERLRKVYPSFDLRREYSSSPELRQLLHAGVSLRRAFETVNLENIMGSVLRFAVMRAGKQAADSMKNPARTAENSLSDRASSASRTDVKNLTEKDIMRIMSQVSKGAKITF